LKEKSREKFAMTEDSAKTASTAASTVDWTSTTASAKPGVDDSKKEKKNRGPPPGIKPKPKLSKQERREIQEKQRAEKAAKQQQQQGNGGGVGKQQKPQQTKSQDGNKEVNIKESSKTVTTKLVVQDNSLSLFSHLPQPRGKDCLHSFCATSWVRWRYSPFILFTLPTFLCVEIPNPYAPEWTSTLHPDVIDLGLKFASGEIHEDNARCRSMMLCFLQVLQDYQLPTEESAAVTIDFRTHFDHQVLKPSFQFWTVQCRPHSVSMGNAFTFLKTAVASLERDLPLDEAKEVLRETMKQYLLERLEYADRAIAQHAMNKLQNGDVILTFGYSEVIKVLLTTAQQNGIDFYVWITDSRPLSEGKELLKTLQNAGIKCGYLELSALTYVLQQVSKVFLGASALMSNGSIYGRIGTAAVAMLAKDRHVPVLVCCESYKISNKVQVESITQNELGDPKAILPLGKTNAKFKVLNLMYDVTPSEFVSGIVTELGIIPPTSVAVLLSEMNPQDASYT
jgi:translation initiation factor eIF-2B subunit delta